MFHGCYKNFALFPLINQPKPLLSEIFWNYIMLRHSHRRLLVTMVKLIFNYVHAEQVKGNHFTT